MKSQPFGPLDPAHYRELGAARAGRGLRLGRRHDRGHGAGRRARPRHRSWPRRRASSPGSTSRRGVPPARSRRSVFTVHHGDGDVAASRATVDRRGRRAGAAAAHRRAHRAELPAAAVRHRHADARASSRPRPGASSSSTRARRRRRCALLEKYAVRAGGGTNHRLALDDGILIKDNHIRLAGGVARGDGARCARRSATCRSRSRRRASTQLDEALAAGATRILARQPVDSTICARP